MGKESLKKKSEYIYKKLIHFTVHLKLTQHCKLTICQQKFEKTKQKNNTCEHTGSSWGTTGPKQFTEAATSILPSQFYSAAPNFVFFSFTGMAQWP